MLNHVFGTPADATPCDWQDVPFKTVAVAVRVQVPAETTYDDVRLTVDDALAKAGHLVERVDVHSDPDVLFNLGLIYLPVAAALYGLGLLCLFAFNIDRAKHEDNLRKLDEAAALVQASGDPA